MLCAYIALVCPVGMSPMQRRGQVSDHAAREAQGEGQSDTLDLLEEGLNKLTVAVPFTWQE